MKCNTIIFTSSKNTIKRLLSIVVACGLIGWNAAGLAYGEDRYDATTDEAKDSFDKVHGIFKKVVK